MGTAAKKIKRVGTQRPTKSTATGKAEIASTNIRNTRINKRLVNFGNHLCNVFFSNEIWMVASHNSLYLIQELILYTSVPLNTFNWIFFHYIPQQISFLVTA